MPNFDSLARPYRWLEYLSFGPMLMLCRCQYLHKLAGRRHALVLGDGDGRFLARLLSAAPELTADVVDSSEEMLRILSQRVAAVNASGRISLQLADALTLRPRARDYDLVVSHFFLDCFTDFQVVSVLERVVPFLAPGALWVLADFEVPASSGGQRFIPLVAHGVIRSLYSIFGFATGLSVRALPDYATAMSRHGFRRIARHARVRGLLVSELWILGSSQPSSNADPADH